MGTWDRELVVGGIFLAVSLIGLQIVTEKGEALGTLKDVLETGANDVYVVTQDEDDWLLPAIKDVVRAIDLERNEMIVHLLPGLRPD